MLSLSLFPYSEILFNELLLESISFGDCLIMMFQDPESVLEFIKFLLREPLDFTRLKHLNSFIIFIKDQAICMPGPLTDFRVL